MKQINTLLNTLLTSIFTAVLECLLLCQGLSNYWLSILQYYCEKKVKTDSEGMEEFYFCVLTTIELLHNRSAAKLNSFVLGS